MPRAVLLAIEARAKQYAQNDFLRGTVSVVPEDIQGIENRTWYRAQYQLETQRLIAQKPESTK